MILERFAYDPEYTMGRLFLDDVVLWTIEQPWNNNQIGKSCVPDGEYDLEPHSSKDHPHTWALVNHGLGIAHFPTPGVLRAACLIHSANWAFELEGCIAPGLTKVISKKAGHEYAMSVQNSRGAMDKLRSALGTIQNPKLIIRPYEGAVYTGG